MPKKDGPFQIIEKYGSLMPIRLTLQKNIEGLAFNIRDLIVYHGFQKSRIILSEGGIKQIVLS